MKAIIAELFVLVATSQAFTVPLRAPSTVVRRLGPLRESKGPPGFPNEIIYPKPGWGLSKPDPKKSLEETGTSWSAKVWILNLIEFVHWFSFPIGFGLFWKMFCNANELGLRVYPEDPKLGIFFLMLAHLCQVFGGGISGNMMHQYEGWQVAVFRNPLKSTYVSDDGVMEKEPEYNDAWLRAVAYQMLFSFQTLGVLFTSIGVFGIKNNAMKILSAVTGLVISLAPQLPHCTSVFPCLMKKVGLSKPWKWLTNGDRPVFPLSIWLFAVFFVNSLVATAAYVSMFGAIDWTGVPIVSRLPSSLAAMIPFGLVASGGIFEGLVAETSFNQWHHFVAFILLDTGLFLHIPYYMRLIGM